MDPRLREMVAGIEAERCSIARCGRPAAAVVEPEERQLAYFCEQHAERASRFRVPAYQRDEREGVRAFAPAEDGSQASWERKWSSEGFHGVWETPSIPAEVRTAVEEGWFPPGGRVLDIGCGRGEIAAWLAEQGYDVLGVDFSESAIAKAEAQGERPGLAFEVLDIRHEAPPDGAFDVLLDRGCLQHVREEDTAAYVRHVTRAARPGARFLLLLPASPWRRDEWTSYIEGLLRPAFDVERVTEAAVERAAGERARALPMVAFWATRR